MHIVRDTLHNMVMEVTHDPRNFLRVADVISLRVILERLNDGQVDLQMFGHVSSPHSLLKSGFFLCLDMDRELGKLDRIAISWILPCA